MKNIFAFYSTYAGYTVFFLTLLLSSCDKAKNNPSPQVRPTVGNSASTGNYLTFASREEFEEAIHNIDELAPGETIDQHLKLWEEEHGGFYSLRRKHEENAAQGDSAVSPINDDYFATMVSPEGTIQIADRIYRLDFEQKRVYHIPAAQAGELYEEMIASPSNNQIKYYLFDEPVLDYITTEDQGTPSSQSRLGISLGSGVSCGNGAEALSDDDEDYLASNKRIKCNVEYQKFGLYFSLLAKAKYQERFMRVWWAEDACMTIVPDPGAFWREKCLTNTNTYNGYISNSCDDNTVVMRYHKSTRGLNKYQIAVKFRVGNFNSQHYYINQ
ncbi:hypothetical protein [Hymenobacter algoricola]|uniref:DUF4848 domain-containing protein n=1 Tax=Hymenobacter algoricola TaxID=486267 RepID=A0ABP7MYM5_9BACT